MASIGLQKKARAGGKRLTRPTAKVRKSALSDTGLVIEVTGADGTKVLIDIDTHRDNRGLCVAPRARFDGSNPAGEDVSVYLGGHSGHSGPGRCALFENRGPEVRCDCGAMHRPHGHEWAPR